MVAVCKQCRYKTDLIGLTPLEGIGRKFLVLVSSASLGICSQNFCSGNTSTSTRVVTSSPSWFLAPPPETTLFLLPPKHVDGLARFTTSECKQRANCDVFPELFRQLDSLL